MSGSVVVTGRNVGAIAFPTRKAATDFHQALERQFRCQHWGLVRLELPGRVAWVDYADAKELAKRLGDKLSETD